MNHEQPSNSMLRSRTTRSEAQKVGTSDDTLLMSWISRRKRLLSMIGIVIAAAPSSQKLRHAKTHFVGESVKLASTRPITLTGVTR